MSENEIHLKENFRDFQLTLPDTFKCSVCPARFRYRSSLNGHYANVHQKCWPRALQMRSMSVDFYKKFEFE